MKQWWRDLNGYGPVLYLPAAFIGLLGGGAALGLLAIALSEALRQVMLSKWERLVYIIVAFAGWWAVGCIISFSTDPIKATRIWIVSGWLCVAAAGGVYLAAALMGR